MVLDPHTAIVAELVKLMVELRKQRGLSQETLASSRAVIGHMESGRTTPTLLLLLKIASVLEVDLFQAASQSRATGRDLARSLICAGESSLRPTLRRDDPAFSLDSAP